MKATPGGDARLAKVAATTAFLEEAKVLEVPLRDWRSKFTLLRALTSNTVPPHLVLKNYRVDARQYAEESQAKQFVDLLRCDLAPLSTLASTDRARLWFQMVSFEVVRSSKTGIFPSVVLRALCAETSSNRGASCDVNCASVLAAWHSLFSAGAAGAPTSTELCTAAWTVTPQRWPAGSDVHKMLAMCSKFEGGRAFIEHWATAAEAVVSTDQTDEVLAAGERAVAQGQMAWAVESLNTITGVAVVRPSAAVVNGERLHALAKAVGEQTGEILRPVVHGVQHVFTHSTSAATVATDVARAIDQLKPFAPAHLVDLVQWFGNWCAGLDCIQTQCSVDATAPGTLPSQADFDCCLAVVAAPCDTSSLVGHAWADLASLGFTGELMQRVQEKSNEERAHLSKLTSRWFAAVQESPAVAQWQAFQDLGAAQLLPPDDKASSA